MRKRIIIGIERSRPLAQYISSSRKHDRVRFTARDIAWAIAVCEGNRIPQCAYLSGSLREPYSIARVGRCAGIICRGVDVIRIPCGGKRTLWRQTIRAEHYKPLTRIWA